jgi:hypothetical protein
MTILGAIATPEKATLWTDSTLYRGLCPVGECPKLSINPLACIAGIGSGSVQLNRTAESVIQTSLCVDDLERRMPDALRKAAGEIADEMTARSESWFFGHTLICAGFSEQAGRMVCWRFAAAAFFAPELLSRFGCPRNDLIDVMLPHPCTPARITEIGRRQMDALRTEMPMAIGGSLMVVELTEYMLHCWRVPDFDVSPLAAPEFHPLDEMRSN